MSSKTTDAAQFAAAFDDGEDIGAHIDWPPARRPGLAKRRVDIDFTTRWSVASTSKPSGAASPARP